VSPRLRLGDAEFEVDFDPGEVLPPGVERVEEGDRPAEASGKILAYARELAISEEHVAHWVAFFREHPQGRRLWEEIRRLWKPGRKPPSSHPRR
jgi:hypothetical protein